MPINWRSLFKLPPLVERFISFSADLINEKSPKSSRRAIAMVVTANFCVICWYVITRKRVLVNADLVKEVITAHLWLMGIALGSVAAGSLTKGKSTILNTLNVDTGEQSTVATTATGEATK